MIYSGIGNRKIPAESARDLEKISVILERKYNAYLRTGGAIGSDTAFARYVTNKQIILPYNGYNNLTTNSQNVVVPTYSDAVWDVACNFHPKGNFIRKKRKYYTLARNVCILLGDNLRIHSNFVLYWLGDNVTTGGTVHALKIAKRYRIPTYNMNNDEEFRTFFKEYCTDEKQ